MSDSVIFRLIIYEIFLWAICLTSRCLQHFILFSLSTTHDHFSNYFETKVEMHAKEESDELIKAWTLASLEIISKLKVKVKWWKSSKLKCELKRWHAIKTSPQHSAYRVAGERVEKNINWKNAIIEWRHLSSKTHRTSRCQFYHGKLISRVQQICLFTFIWFILIGLTTLPSLLKWKLTLCKNWKHI